jgi:TM2 domain-containing protein
MTLVALRPMSPQGRDERMYNGVSEYLGSTPFHTNTTSYRKDAAMSYEQPPDNYGQQQYAPPPMQSQMGGSVQSQGYDWTVALVLSILLGEFGVDRFYTGSIMLGLLKLITFGGCGIWWLIDVILIATGAYKDQYGHPLVRKL